MSAMLCTSCMACDRAAYSLLSAGPGATFAGVALCVWQSGNGATKPLSHSNSSTSLTDQQQQGPPADSSAANPATADTATISSSSSRDTGGGSNAGTAAAAAAAVLQQEVGRLRQEVRCLRTTLGTLYVTCSHLREVRGCSCKAAACHARLACVSSSSRWRAGHACRAHLPLCTAVALKT